MCVSLVLLPSLKWHPHPLKSQLSLERTKLGELEAAWEEMEANETGLRDQLQTQAARLRGAALEFERLRRGCHRVDAWLKEAMPTLSSGELGASEPEVIALIAEADALSAPLALQIKATAGLAKLVERLEADEEYGALAKELFAPIGSIKVRDPAVT